MSLFLVNGLLAAGALAAGPLGWVAASMAAPVAVGVGLAQMTANTVASVIILAYNTWEAPDAAETIAKIDDLILSWLDATSDWARNMTGKIFGSDVPADADIWNFLGRVRPEYKDVGGGSDWQAIMRLFADGQFLEPSETRRYVDGLMETGQHTLKLGIISQIYKAASVMAVSFKKYDTEEKCKERWDPDYAWVDNRCWILWETPHASPRRAPDGKPAPNGVLSKTIGKYNVDKDWMFRNILECDNNQEMMDKNFDSLSFLDENIGKCVFPIFFLHVCEEGYWGDGNKTAAAIMGLELDWCEVTVPDNQPVLKCLENTCK